MTKDVSDKVLKGIIVHMRNLRVEQGLSVEVFAEMVGVSLPDMILFEDQKNTPDLLFCLRVADALGVNLSDIISKSEDS